ncbi:hypothetical protein BJ170DRAFT_279368 [Xylariales sp. AK1849]|nr:hypothetical protein BJ170DRAFT_279368 [Xylariales sp. AK1849]
MRPSVLPVIASLILGGVQAQQTGGTYTDPVTGFTFQRYANGNYTFGIAVPEDITTDFIGQFSVDAIQGWAGVSLGGTMIGSLLVVVFPNGDSIQSSLRQADDYVSPHIVNGTDAAIQPIPSGTYVNGTAYTFTFLCSKCILTDGRTFTPNETTPILGWTQSPTALQDTSHNDAVLNFHINYGSWGVDLAAAKSPDYDSWAALALSSS